MATRGEKIKQVAEEMAKRPPGSRTEWVDIDGYDRYALKDADGGDKAGLHYALNAIGARMVRGGNVRQDEVDALVKKASRAGAVPEGEDPKTWVRDQLTLSKIVAGG